MMQDGNDVAMALAGPAPSYPAIGADPCVAAVHAAAYELKANELRKAEIDAACNPSPLDVQVAGDHYKKLKIQPVEYIHANGLPFIEGSVIKYVTRWRDKGGVKDLEKARHFLDLLIELEGRK